MSKFIIVDFYGTMMDDEYDTLEAVNKEIDGEEGYTVYEVVRKFESEIPEIAILKEVPLCLRL